MPMIPSASNGAFVRRRNGSVSVLPRSGAVYPGTLKIFGSKAEAKASTARWKDEGAWKKELERIKKADLQRVIREHEQEAFILRQKNDAEMARLYQMREYNHSEMNQLRGLRDLQDAQRLDGWRQQAEMENRLAAQRGEGVRREAELEERLRAQQREGERQQRDMQDRLNDLEEQRRNLLQPMPPQIDVYHICPYAHGGEHERMWSSSSRSHPVTVPCSGLGPMQAGGFRVRYHSEYADYDIYQTSPDPLHSPEPRDVRRHRSQSREHHSRSPKGKQQEKPKAHKSVHFEEDELERGINASIETHRYERDIAEALSQSRDEWTAHERRRGELELEKQREEFRRFEAQQRATQGRHHSRHRSPRPDPSRVDSMLPEWLDPAPSRSVFRSSSTPGYLAPSAETVTDFSDDEMTYCGSSSSFTKVYSSRSSSPTRDISSTVGAVGSSRAPRYDSPLDDISSSLGGVGTSRTRGRDPLLDSDFSDGYYHATVITSLKQRIQDLVKTKFGRDCRASITSATVERSRRLQVAAEVWRNGNQVYRFAIEDCEDEIAGLEKLVWKLE